MFSNYPKLVSCIFWQSIKNGLIYSLEKRHWLLNIELHSFMEWSEGDDERAIEPLVCLHFSNEYSLCWEIVCFRVPFLLWVNNRRPCLQSTIALKIYVNDVERIVERHPSLSINQIFLFVLQHQCNFDHWLHHNHLPWHRIGPLLFYFLFIQYLPYRLQHHPSLTHTFHFCLIIFRQPFWLQDSSHILHDPLLHLRNGLNSKFFSDATSMLA